MRRAIFDSEHEAFRESVRGFLQREAVPHGPAWEASGIVDRGFWKKAAAQGFVAFSAPEEHGGAGQTDFRFNAVLDEEVVFTGTVGDGFTLTNDIVAPYLTELADEAQQARWLPGVTSGERVCAIAMTEPGAGSDLRGIAAKAARDGDVYRLSGAKTFVSSGIQADLVIVAARTGEGLSLLMVEDGMAGFSRGRKLEKIGRRAQDTAELFFDDVAVPVENRLGEEGRGLHHLMANLAQERLSMAVTAVADAERALELTLEYVRSRNAFGRPVGSFQANRFALAELTTETRAARVYLDHCLLRHSTGGVARPGSPGSAGALDDAEAAGLKYLTTELQFKVLDRCLQLHGGYGYMEEYEIARRWRDARVTRIYGGTTEIMKEIVGRSLGL